MKFQKCIALGLAAVMMAALAGGCGSSGEEEGKINLKIGGWPDETQESYLKKQNELRDKFMEEHQDIIITPDTYNYDTKTFTMKATANQLPNMFKPWFTEIKQLISQGYVADITDAMKAHGFDTAINPTLMDFVKDDEGRIYGVPTDAYAQGLYINKKLFKEAGLVNEDGTVKVPSTYQEVAEFAKIIKEKTGQAGFILPTTNNCGGWHFLNIAWSYGVEFMKQRDDGTWEATFDTQEAREALQYVYDLKWKYDAFPAETVLNQDDIYKYFGTYQAAMMFADPPCGGLTSKYGMEIDDIFVTRMPEGPKGRYSQMGGNLWMFSKASTPEQIDAGLKWLEFTGFAPDVTDEQLDASRVSYQQTLDNNGIVLDQNAFDVWSNSERVEKERAVKSEYTNVRHEDYEQYYSFEGVTINPEPAACAQQLYSIMDRCIQEVITNKDANIDELIKTANNDFQTNHLDKM